MTNLAVNLTETAAMYPEATALSYGGSDTTFGALDDAASRFATFLTTAGLSPGDPVGLMLPNIPAFAVVYYGVLRAGGVVVPMNPLQSQREIEYFLTNTDARMLFAHPDYATHATAAAAATRAAAWLVDDRSLTELITDHEPTSATVPRADADTAVILHTSGTTGKPKGAELTHANLHKNQAVSARQLLHLDHPDVVLGCLPLFHAFGMTCALNAAVAAGAKLVLMARFAAADALELIDQNHVTVFAGVPTMYTAMLHAKGDQWSAQSLRTCISGGAALPVEVLRSFEARYGCVILEGYGLSESSPVACFNLPDRVRKIGSIGVPVEGIEMRVVDDSGNPVAPDVPGEIEIRGHNVMKGYWRLPDATEATIKDGWLATGDIGRCDEDGFFYIVDRKKSLIIRGGFNVYPREVEEVLYEHPAVAEAAVVGFAHDVHGEEIGAAVALKDGATVTAEELKTFVKERVAPYKYPRKVWFVDELPKGATGKILRREIVVPIEADA